MGILYLVATPIGNLEDISTRALRVLREVNLIAAEDTRKTRKLLSHFDIHVPLTSYFEHNKRSKLEHVIEALEKGDVALVSDAGTPALNDPGYELVRATLQAGYTVSPIPGACAPVAALVASGLPTDAFLYLGYLPRQSGARQRVLQEVARLPYTLIFLETPHRLLESLDDLEAVLGNRQMAAARELTKLYEEITRGTISEIKNNYQNRPLQGEFTLVVAGQSMKKEAWSEDRLNSAIREAISQGEPPACAASRISTESGWPRRKVYSLYTGLRSGDILPNAKDRNHR
jgi:16S rRNA (cytidine1402-2'-O)-methyltransferase